MSLIYNSLSHSKWDCKYHIIFIPKMRKNRLYGDICPRLGQIFHALAAQKDVKIVEGYTGRPKPYNPIRPLSRYNCG